MPVRHSLYITHRIDINQFLPCSDGGHILPIIAIWMLDLSSVWRSSASHLCNMREACLKPVNVCLSCLPASINSIWAILWIHFCKLARRVHGKKHVSLLLLSLSTKNEKNKKACTDQIPSPHCDPPEFNNDGIIAQRSGVGKSLPIFKSRIPVPSPCFPRTPAPRRAPSARRWGGGRPPPASPQSARGR